MLNELRGRDSQRRARVGRRASEGVRHEFKRVVIAIVALVAVGAVAVGAFVLVGGGKLSPEEAMAATIEKVEALETYAWR